MTALMPNLIHSLDASSLALLTDKFFNHSSENYFSQIKNIYTIHDCFASTANNMKFIVCLLKLSYISIYTDKGYLKKFNKDIIDHIKLHIGEDFDEENLKITMYTGTNKKKKK